MNYNEFPLEALIKQLLHGWQPWHSGAAQEFVRRLGACLKASTEIKEIGENVLLFVTEMEGIYLRDMNSVPGLILSGGVADSQTAREFCKKLAHRLSFILALSDASLKQVKEEFPYSRFLLLSVEQTRQLLKASNSRQLLRPLLWQQISKRRLIPYNILHPAIGNMFFGRGRELNRLRDENHTSFAIAGPGRIGKTSIITRYRDKLRQTKDPMGPLTFYINFYDCSDHRRDSVAKFFAKKIEPTRWSDRMMADQLVNFLHYQANKLGGPLNLLLDEVDEVCKGDAFNAIAVAARSGYCRLILGGRGVLLNTMLNPKSPLQNRLNLIQLEPLDERSSRELILRPLTDLGFRLESEDVINQILHITGRLPHLLHLYGGKLANLAIEEDTDTISLNLIETLKWDFVVAQYFISPLFDLKDPEARIVGLSLLKSTSQDFSIPIVQKIAAQAGLELDYTRTREICNDLLINNVLVWRNGTYRIANEGLYFYAREMGFLEGALKEALDQLDASA